jgi:hypothetical protein
MDSSFASLKWRLLLAVAALMMAAPAGAQTETRGGQPILFSSPDNDTISTNVPSLAPKPPELSGLPDGIHAPDLHFSGSSPAAPLPPVPVAPVISPAEAQRLQTLIDKRKNWTLLTPEEILDVPTPEKILGIQEYGADGLPEHESLVARFYERQEHQLSPTTNATGFYDHSRAPDFSDSRPSPWTLGFLNVSNNSPANLTPINQFMGSAAANNTIFSQDPGDGWSSFFHPPAAKSSAPTPQQQTAMEQFRQLLEPRSPPPTAFTSSTGTKPFSQPQTASDSVFGKSPLNTIGAPLAALSGGVGTPLGVAPLPGLLGPTNTPAATVAPSWKPELPPWMSQGPQPGVIPQRKF